MNIEAFFRAAQTGVGYQFYDATGVLLGSRVTSGISEGEGEAGHYLADATLPAGAAGVVWDSTETPEGISEDLRDAIAIATLGTRLSDTRAGYLDKLNVSGALAHSDAAATYKADVSGLATAIAVAAVQVTADAIEAKTTNLPASPAATGAAMTLTSGERTALAAALEAAIINELDGTAVMQAIADLIASDMTTGDLTVQAIAAACRDAILDRVLSGNHDTAGTLGKLTQDGATAVALAAVSALATAIDAKTANLPASPASTGDCQTGAAAAIAAFDPPTKEEMDAALAALNDIDGAAVELAVISALGTYGAATTVAINAVPAAVVAAMQLVADDFKATGFAVPGSAMTLTAGERTSLAAALEAAIINELDGTAVMQAIADLIASDMTTGDLTVQAIATACRDAVLNRVLNGNHDTAGTVGKILQDAATAAALASVSALITGVKGVTDLLPDSGALTSLATAAAVAAVQSTANAINAKTINLPASPAAVGSEMGLAAGAITESKFDGATAFPLKSVDSGATQVARTGADGDTLETISDEIAAVDAGTAPSVEEIEAHLAGIHGSGPWGPGSLGDGVNDVVITVDDGTDPVENAAVRVSLGITSHVYSTDANGQITFHLGTGTWSIVAIKAGYTSGSGTVEVPGSLAATVSLTRNVVTPPEDPSLCLVHVNSMDIKGRATSGIVVTLKLNSYPAKSSKVLSSVVGRIETNAAGYAEGTFIRNDSIGDGSSKYVIDCPALGIREEEVSLASGTFDIASLI